MSVSVPQLSSSYQPFNETVFYGDGLAWVTDKRVVFHNTMYWLSDVKSASIESFRSDQDQKWSDLYLVAYTATCLILGLVMILRGSADDMLQWFGYILVGGMLILVPLFWFLRQRIVPATVWGLRLADARGSSIVFAALDQSYIARLMDLINYAIENGAQSLDEQSARVELISRLPEDIGHIYYQDARNRVGSTYLVLEGKTYPLSEVRSAYVLYVRYDKWQRLALVILPLFLAYPLALTIGLITSTSERPQVSDISWFPFNMLWILAVNVVNILQLALIKQAHVVVLEGTFGRVAALATLKDYYARNMANLIKGIAKGRR